MAIIGYSEMMLESMQDGGDATALAPDMRKVEGNARHLLGLINDVLDLSKVESGKMEVYAENFDVEATVREIASTAEALVGKKNKAHDGFRGDGLAPGWCWRYRPGSGLRSRLSLVWLIRGGGVFPPVCCAMASSALINLTALIDDAKCFELIRHHRWPEGIRFPSCTSATVVRNGRDDTQYERRRYLCKSCETRFDDLSGIILAGHHQPLRVWVLGLYFMGLNLSNLQIAKELGLDASDVQVMTSQLREGLTARAP